MAFTAYEKSMRNRRKKIAIVRSLKEGNPCTDCKGRFHHAAMQWDHLPGTEKVANVSEMYVNHGIESILREIEKCELVCANCHAVRTYERGVAQSG